MSCILALLLQVAELKRELQGSQAKVEQQERELGAAHQKLQTLEEASSRLQQESAALSQQKAEVDRLQGLHAEHAHIFRQDSLATLCLTKSSLLTLCTARWQHLMHSVDYYWYPLKDAVLRLSVPRTTATQSGGATQLIFCDAEKEYCSVHPHALEGMCWERHQYGQVFGHLTRYSDTTCPS